MGGGGGVDFASGVRSFNLYIVLFPHVLGDPPFIAIQKYETGGGASLS